MLSEHVTESRSSTNTKGLCDTVASSPVGRMGDTSLLAKAFQQIRLGSSGTAFLSLSEQPVRRPAKITNIDATAAAFTNRRTINFP